MNENENTRTPTPTPPGATAPIRPATLILPGSVPTTIVDKNDPNRIGKLVNGVMVYDPAFTPVLDDTENDTTKQDDGNGADDDSEMDQSEPPVGPRVRVYPLNHKGPFTVYIRADKTQSLRHLQISKLLFSKYGVTKIGKVLQMNNHKLRIELKSAEAANELVKDKDPLFSPYRVYIPAEQVEVEGIVRLSTEEPTSELLIHGRGQFSEPNIADVGIIDAFRFENVTRDSAGETTSKIPTSLVRVTFPGNLLPRRVVLHGLLIPVEPYKRKAMFCENCLRTGHTEKFCVVKPKCAKCGAEHKSNECQQSQQIQTTVKCFVCGTAHDPNDRKVCPKIKQANAQHQKQSKRKIFQSYADAVRQVKSNYYSLLSTEERNENDDDEDEDEDTITEIQYVPRDAASRGAKRRKTVVAPATGDNTKAKPTSVTKPTVKDSEPSTSSAGNSRGNVNKTHGPKNPPRKAGGSEEANQSSQSFIQNLRPLLNNFVNLLPIDAMWKQLIQTGLNFLLDTLYPLLYPLLSPLITSLISNNLNGC